MNAWLMYKNKHNALGGWGGGGGGRILLIGARVYIYIYIYIRVHVRCLYQIIDFNFHCARPFRMQICIFRAYSLICITI